MTVATKKYQKTAGGNDPFKQGLATQHNALCDDVEAMLTPSGRGVYGYPAIGDGSTAGYLALGDVNEYRKLWNKALGSGGLADGTTAGKIALGTVNNLLLMTNYAETLLASTLAAATQNGKIKIVTNSVYYKVAGVDTIKAPTDNLWDLSALGILGGAEYMATILYLDGSGTASISSSPKKASAAAAIAALPYLSASKTVIGVFVGNPACNYANAIPAAQGTLYQGLAPGMASTDLQTNIRYTIGGTMYRKVFTDDCWDLSGETDTTGAQYRAYWLYLDSSGVATFAAGANAASAALAYAALPKITSTKSVIGTYLANPSTDFNGAAGLASFGVYTNGFVSNVAPGTSAFSFAFGISGTRYSKNATDDLWNLSGETDTTGVQYRAYWLYLNSSGTASFAASTNAASLAAALAALPTIDPTKAVIGIYVASPSCDFNGAAGLAAQGTIYNGWAASQLVSSYKVASD